MNLQDILSRSMEPKPWEEGERVPWDDAAFSRRVLEEHLSQDNDAASRPQKIIKKHVDWIHKTLLAAKKSHILDLGCGPGLYTVPLAKLGHQCNGVDVAPAAIEYALKHAPHNCTYQHGDVRTADFGAGYDLVIFIFGAFNLFKPEDARLILRRIYACLKPGGLLLVEASSLDAVDQIGNQPSMWYSAEKALFSDAPHLCLMETFWDDEQKTATERFYIIETATGKVHHHAASTQGYEDEEIEAMLEDTGFGGIEFHPSMTGREDDEVNDFLVITAKKPV